MVNEDQKINPASKKYIITFKPKDQRHNKTDDKVDILRSITGLGDYENTINLTSLRIGDKFHASNKRKTGRNETDQFNPAVPSTETIHYMDRYNFPVVMAKLTPEQHQAVRKDPNVLMVEEETIGYPTMSSSTSGPQQIPYGITRVKAPDEWLASKKRGSGVNVAIIDSGMDDSHPDLQFNSWGGISFVSEAADWFDGGLHIGTLNTPLVYHGTHIAGTIGAADNQEGVVGIAPEAKLWALRVYVPTSLTTTDTIIMSALEWAMVNNFDVVNISSSGFGFLTAMQTLIQQVYDALCIICVSSGNGGNKTMDPTKPASNQGYPGGYPGAIEVSSIGPTDLTSSFSNYGTKTEFAAPGENVLSTWLATQFGGYSILSGTSMSCAHVSGLFAIAQAAYRYSPCSDMYNASNNSNDVLRTAARQTADKLGKFADRDPVNALGYGIPNVAALAAKLLNPDIHVQTVA